MKFLPLVTKKALTHTEQVCEILARPLVSSAFSSEVDSRRLERTPFSPLLPPASRGLLPKGSGPQLSALFSPLENISFLNMFNGQRNAFQLKPTGAGSVRGRRPSSCFTGVAGLGLEGAGRREVGTYGACATTYASQTTERPFSLVLTITG